MFIPILRRFSSVVLALIVALGAGNALAADTSFIIQVPSAGKITIVPPAGWTHRTDRPPPGIPPTVDFTSPGGILLKVTFWSDPKGQFANADELDKQVTKANQQYADNSVEKQITLERLASTSGPGVYASFTDPKLANVAKPPAGEFRHVSSGAISLGRQILIFSLLSNRRDTDEYRQALDFLIKGIHVAAAAP